jgi:hypothetical protein
MGMGMVSRAIGTVRLPVCGKDGVGKDYKPWQMGMFLIVIPS